MLPEPDDLLDRAREVLHDVFGHADFRPGQEEATYERIKKLIVASAPEFQLTPSSKTQVAATQP